MSGKIALITGGSRGLGRNTALHLAKAGVGVVLTYHSRKDQADAAVAEVEAAGSQAAALQLDTADTSGFAAFTEELTGTLHRVWGRRTLDFLVNNAGSGVHKSFAETTEEEFDRMVNEHT